MAKKTEKTKSSPLVNLIVFKDALTARSFQIPLRWFSEFGLLLAALTLVTLVSSFYAIKYYRLSQRILAQKIAPLEKPPETEMEQSTSTQPPPPSTISALLFQALPPDAKNLLSDQSSVTINDIQTALEGSQLKIHFRIEYIKKDGGSQQGRILVLAQAPNSLWTYPTEAFNPLTESTLLSPAKGEFFSVSRFREVNVTFGPITAKNQTPSSIALLFDNDGNLIYKQNLLNTPGETPQNGNR